MVLIRVRDEDGLEVSAQGHQAVGLAPGVAHVELRVHQDGFGGPHDEDRADVVRRSVGAETDQPELCSCPRRDRGGQDREHERDDA